MKFKFLYTLWKKENAQFPFDRKDNVNELQ